MLSIYGHVSWSFDRLLHSVEVVVVPEYFCYYVHRILIFSVRLSSRHIKLTVLVGSILGLRLGVIQITRHSYCTYGQLHIHIYIHMRDLGISNQLTFDIVC
jgi:hypothetical protein